MVGMAQMTSAFWCYLKWVANYHLVCPMYSEVSIIFLVSSWFCKGGSCGKQGAVRESINISNIREAEHTEKDFLIFWLFS